MTREKYLKEFDRFYEVLRALDATHRLSGSIYTPAEIKDVRRTVRLLRQIVEIGSYDLHRKEVAA